MDIFGITPQDASLSALGLNLSQALMDFLFSKSKIGYLAFCVGFLYSVWSCVKTGSFKRLIIHATIFIFTLLLIAMPARQEGNIKSAWEEYGTSTAYLRTHDLKQAQSNLQTLPVLLTFVAQALDAFVIGSIAVISRSMPDYAQYLTYPFGLQEISLRLNAQLQEGINDLRLKKDVQDFAYSSYLPALAMSMQDTSSITDPSLYKPSNTNIKKHYSEEVQRQWEALQGRIKNYVNVVPSAWPQAKEMMNGFYEGQNLTVNDDVYVDELVLVESRVLASKKAVKHDWYFQAARYLLQSYPYVQGVSNLCVYIFFPIVLCLTLALARLEPFFFYIKSFLGVKLLSFTAFLAYFISLIIARAQAQTIIVVQWFWQEPYFALGAGMLVYLFFIMVLFLVFRGINFKTH